MFAAYSGNSYFPNLKVLKLDTVYGATIGYNTFNNMTSLETITLPNNLEKIENDAQHPEIIKTVRGIGYKVD